MGKEALRFLWNELLARVPLPKLPDAITAMLPLATELLLSDSVLTDDVRADIQKRILQVLDNLGLEGRDL